jgi:DNA-binding MarR family transcriptional regulator
MRRGARLADPGNPLTVAQLELLSTLAEVPGADPGELAQLLRIRQNRVATMVTGLCGKGMIRREADGHSVRLTVTDAGWRSVQEWQATNAAVLHLALSGLPERQRKALTAAVPALAALAGAVDRLGGRP